MKILYLTQWYRPEPLTYQSDLAETLQSQGHDVTVLTGFPNWPSGDLAPGYKIRHWQKENVRGIPVIRVPLFPDHSTSAKRRVLNFTSFALSASVLGPWLAERCDLVHCNFPPVTLGAPAWILSRLMRAPLTFEVQDLWPETLQATDMLRNPTALKMVDLVARWGYRRAAAIRVISPGFREHLIAKGIPAERIKVISNWVDTERYCPRPKDPAVEAEYGLQGRVNVMYAGTIGAAQGLDALIDAAKLLVDRPELQFVLVGDGTELPRLKKIACENNLSNVKFIGRVSPERMAAIYPFADLLFMAMRDDPLFRITIPHKIFAYMAAGSPLLAAAEGNAADVVRDANAGFTCPPGNPTALADALLKFLSLSPERRRALGENGRKTVLEKYNRELLVRQVAEMFEEALTRRRKGNK